MTVEIVPSLVVWAQLENYVSSLDEVLSLLAESQDDTVKKAIGEWETGYRQSLRRALTADGSSSQSDDATGVADTDSSHYDQMFGSGPVRSDFLLPNLEIRPRKMAMWLSVMLGLRSVPELFVAFLSNSDSGDPLHISSGKSNVLQKPDCFSILSNEDYIVLRTAILLSCGNPYGVCLKPKPFSVQQLVDNLIASRADKGDLDTNIDAWLADIAQQAASAPSLRESISSEQEKELKRVFRNLIKSSAEFCPVVDNCGQLPMGDRQKLKRECKDIVKKYMDRGLFESVGRNENGKRLYRYSVL